ncbi:MAG: hypothetical protein GC162_04365 [Planctomycetes bacterium]|nr:hypothetical protein [Planctomycetota bacterium]
MSDLSPQPTAQMYRTCIALLDGVLDAASQRQAMEMMRTDARMSRAYVELCWQRAALIESASGARAVLAAPTVALDRPRFPVGRLLGLAAMIALAVGLMYVFLPPSPRSEVRVPTAAKIAMLSDKSDDAVFDQAAGAPQLGDALSAGPVKLLAGKVQLRFESSAVVDLTGPCSFEMTGKNRAMLTAGRLVALVRPEAHGFTVDLPGGGRVIDLGTRFELDCDVYGAAILKVREGIVRAEANHGSQMLVAGQQAYIRGDLLVIHNADQPASPITWRGPIDTVGIESIDRAGVLVGAFNAGGAAGQTIAVPIGDVTMDFVGTGSAPFGKAAMGMIGASTHTPLQSVLDTVSFGDASLRPLMLEGLTPGRRYQVQVFFADARAGGLDQIAMAFIAVGRDPMVLHAAGAARMGQTALGEFTADWMTQKIDIMPRGRANAHINAWIVRDVTDISTSRTLQKGD